MKNLIYIILIVIGNSVKAQSDSLIRAKAITAFTIEYFSGARQEFSFGYGLFRSYNKSHITKKSNGGIKRIQLYPQPSYFGFNNGIVLKSDSKQSLIYTPQIQGFLALGIFSGGLRLGYLTDFSEGQWDFVSELGVGWRYMFLKYQHNYFFTSKETEFIAKNRLSLQVFIPIGLKDQ